MRIREIRVNKLFGVFDHTVPLNEEARVTIIHGPNGYGKTVLLQLLDDLFAGRFWRFRATPFGMFTVCFDNGSELDVTKSDAESGQPGLHVRYGKSGRRKRADEIVPVAARRTSEVEYSLASMVENYLPGMERVSRTHWRWVTGEMFSLDDIVERFGDRVPLPISQSHTPDWLKELQQDVHVRLVRTQRLFSSFEHTAPRYGTEGVSVAMPAVKTHSDELAQTIQQTLGRYAAKSQELDRTFPARLMNLDAGDVLDATEIQQRLEELEARRKRLTELGFLDAEGDVYGPPQQVSGKNHEVLSVYVQDVDQKLDVFTGVAKRISLLLQRINDRFLYKHLSVSKDKGFVFSTNEDVQLYPTKLSSGEQHEVVLMYELLFKTQEGSLVMIDEPEISLHIAWQERFLDDLAAVVDVTKFDVLIATHSPEIIGESWDLTVELKGPSS